MKMNLVLCYPFWVVMAIICVQPCQSFSTTPPAEVIEFVPSTVIVDQVSLQYPVTLARRLFSSVPRREFAVDNVSCRFSSEIVLLQGASSSGKSALMKVILGQDKATSGTVSIECSNLQEQSDDLWNAKPVMLAEKPPFDNQRSIRTILQVTPHKLGLETTKLEEKFAQLVLLDAKLWDKKPADLSPSENYRLRLAEAAMDSCLANFIPSSSRTDKLVLLLPAPILLLDEWMDFETRDSSSKVEESLLHLVETTGAVVMSATHKPHLWKKLESPTLQTSQMTMCRGQILSLKQQRSAS